MRTSLALLGPATLALSLACGDSSPAPAPGPSGPDPGAAPTTAGPEPVPAPPGAPPAPQPPAPEPDRFVDVERLDASAECDALVPARVPAPVTVRRERAAQETCGGGISEGGGHVAVLTFLFRQASEWQAFRPDGRPGERFEVDQGALFPQADGWLLARLPPFTTVPVQVELHSLFGDGAPRRSEQAQSSVSTRSWRMVEDPAGGAFLVQTTGASPPASRCEGDGRRFDASGAPRGGAARLGCDLLGAGVSNHGEALVVEGVQGRKVLRWLRPDGSEARPPSDDPGAGEELLSPLLDGSLAARVAGRWVRRYPHLAERGEAAPAWLAARPLETFRFTRGNRGYAFFPAPLKGSPDCRQAVELLAPSGRRCVRLTFREDATGCTTGVIDQGWDGTVVQQSGKDLCTYRWWPALLGP